MGRKNALVGAGLSVVASAGVAAYLAGRRAVPGWTGSVRYAELRDSVDIYRDEWGVPAICAASEHDLFFAQGVSHAADRMFQLDLLRRAGTGRLSEIFGDRTIEADRLIRTLGFHHYADGDVELLGDDAAAALTAYTAGVNAWLRQSRRRLPVEFSMLRYRPEPWRPADSLLATRMMALSLCGNWQSELARGEIAARFGDDVLAVIDADAHARPFAAQVAADVLGELVSATRDITGALGLGYGTGSNNWVIGPRRTASGGALLANDPHLDLTLPSVWYEQLLRCPTYEVRGFTIPGTPGVVLGHNGRIAWGFTNSVVDVQDLFLEDIDEAGTTAEPDGTRANIRTRTERIVVKGGEDVQFTVRETARGPILTDAVSSTLAHPVSLRWDAIRPSRMSDAMFGMNRATSVGEFRDALRLWAAPAQNVVYADTHGNIGYQHAGTIPVRAASNGTIPLRAADPAGEWVGTVPFEDAPWSVNPSADRIVTANDRIVDDTYPHFISVEWMNGYRGERIRNLIDAHDNHSVDDQRQIQMDVHSLPGAQLLGIIAERDPHPLTEAGGEVLAALRGWDAKLDVGSDGATAYRLLTRALQEQVYGFLGEMLATFLGYSRTGIGGFWSLFGRSLPRLIHDMRVDDSTLLELGHRVDATHHAPGWSPSASWQDALERAIDRAGRAWADSVDGSELHPRLVLPGTRASLVDRIGSDRLRRSGASHRRKFHRLRLQHPLGVIPGFASVANHGPFPVPGDADTVWAAGAFNNPLNDCSMVGPSHRHVVDLADLDASMAVLCGGQSGHPASPHYADQVRMWRRGELRPAPWTQTRIERDAAFRQRLEPADSE